MDKTKSIEMEIQKSAEHFKTLLKQQLQRIDKMKSSDEWLDYTAIKPLRIGIVGGDGIGPYICKQAQKILSFLLEEDINNGKLELVEIEGLTIENRVKEGKAIPDGVLKEIKQCHVLLKGPTTTPQQGDQWPNIESANVAMRRELDLFANVRPVKVPEKNIDWIFFRENTEGAYVLGSLGVDVGQDLSVDFKVITEQGAERIIRMAFEYARKNKINRLTVVTKANVVKKTDGRFLNVAARVAAEYPQVKWDDWFIDIMTAKLIDTARACEFKVFVMPNLYGDILTDEAAQIQGGVGTAGSANIGKRYAMFEAIHGSAPRMVEEGRAAYADPSSMIKAGGMLLNHIGYTALSRKLEMATDICLQYERKIKITGRDNGATGEEFAQYVMETVKKPSLEEEWERFQK